MQHTGGSFWSCATIWGGYSLTANLVGTEYCLLPLCWSKSCWGWYDDFQIDSCGSSGLQSHHGVGFHCAHCVPTDEFRKTIGCLEFLIQRQVQSRGILVGELDCLQHLVNRIPLQPFELSMRTDNGNFLRELYGATFFPYEARCNLAGPACRKPRQEGRDSADKIYTIVAPRVGPVGDHNFHGATGGTFSVHVCTLRGCSD